MPWPPASPSSTPPPIWCRKCQAIDQSRAGAPAVVATPRRVKVRKIDIGSLLPDSTSSVERTRPRTSTPPTRSRKNTAAASVELTIAPSSSAVSQSMPSR